MPSTEPQPVSGASGVLVKVGVTIIDPADGRDAFMRQFDEALLEAAKRVLVPALQATLGVMGPPASDPDDPPHRQTDEKHDAQAGMDRPSLYESIAAWREADGSVVVGSRDNDYALFLEIGTQEMAARPWLSPTLARTDVQADFAAALASVMATRGELALPPS